MDIDSIEESLFQETAASALPLTTKRNQKSGSNEIASLSIPDFQYRTYFTSLTMN